MAINKFSTVKLDKIIKITNKSEAHGYISITGRTIPIDQLSNVIIWKSVNMEFPRVPNHSGKSCPNISVVITEKT